MEMNGSGQSIFPPVRLAIDHRTDGSVVLANQLELPHEFGTIPGKLRYWASAAPDRIYLTEPVGDARRVITYFQAQAIVDRCAARLLALGLGDDRPLMTLAANSIDHALVMLAAMSVGIPVAVVSPIYASTAAAPYAKLSHIVQQITPGLIISDDVTAARAALTAIGSEIVPLSIDMQWLDMGWIASLPPVRPDAVERARAMLGPDTIAKLLFTSGSTGTPKAVINTQRMMASNMAALSRVWPFLADRPPVLVDWLPWNHTFGGNCCFNIALYFGGTLHIDQGKPVPALIGRTIEALREIGPSLYFNVPAGYEALLPLLEADHDLAARFLGGLDFLFNAAAAMPASIRARIEELAMATLGRVPAIVGGWGSTETAPFATVLYFHSSHATNLGVPLPGTEIKLVPNGGRDELRVRGPNVTPGYWRDPVASAAAFDDEGFYRIGDAGRLIDPMRPEQGILFDGRIAENFKLLSGTWVNVGALRLAIIAATRPLVSDAVVVGEGRDEIGLLLFCNDGECRQLLGVDAPQEIAANQTLVERIAGLLAGYNANQTGSSMRVSRFLLLSEPPNLQAGEITEKGYLNQRAVLDRRIGDIAALYDRGHIPS
jgi:feruloyl-CoA synthase